MTLSGIVENLLSDLLFIALLVGLGWVWAYLTRRRLLQQFFGASHAKRVVVYLSNIRVLAFGSVDVSGRKKSYQGSTVAHGEMLAANRIRELFSFLVPSSSEGPGFLSRLLLSDVLVQLLLSPLRRSELDSDATLISLGSSAYNAASALIENVTPSGAKFRYGVITRKQLDESSPHEVIPVASSTDAEVHVWGPGTGGSTVSLPSSTNSAKDSAEERPSAIVVEGLPEMTGTNYAFVQRSFEPNSRRMLYYVAGLSEPATAGAAAFLASQWRYLARRYSSGVAFLIMLTFEPPDFRKWSIAFERKLPAAA